MKRLPNHEIGEQIKNLAPFTNYNQTITAEQLGDIYQITHWKTKILDYNTRTSEIMYFHTPYISQTTSVLVGRIARNLPVDSVLRYLEQNTDKKTIRRFIALLSR